jgi:hypothetical protein
MEAVRRHTAIGCTARWLYSFAGAGVVSALQERRERDHGEEQQREPAVIDETPGRLVDVSIIALKARPPARTKPGAKA